MMKMFVILFAMLLLGNALGDRKFEAFIRVRNRTPFKLTGVNIRVHHGTSSFSQTLIAPNRQQDIVMYNDGWNDLLGTASWEVRGKGQRVVVMANVRNNQNEDMLAAGMTNTALPRFDNHHMGLMQGGQSDKVLMFRNGQQTVEFTTSNGFRITGQLRRKTYNKAWLQFTVYYRQP